MRSAMTGIVWPALQSPDAARLLAVCRQLDESQWWPPEVLAAQQRRQLALLLAHAAAIPFWRERSAAAGLEPAREVDPAAFTRLPLLTRRDLQTQGDALRSPGLPPGQSMYAAVAQGGAGEQPPRQINILLRPGEDPERDKRRIRTVHGALISFPGHDRFSFQIFESGKGHLIDFPGDTTRICPELLQRLLKLMGEESWRVEEITFQSL